MVDLILSHYPWRASLALQRSCMARETDLAWSRATSAVGEPTVACELQGAGRSELRYSSGLNCNIRSNAMNDCKGLRTFLIAAERRILAQVGQELDMTEAAVTHATAALEAEPGVQFFVRTTRRVSHITGGAVFAAQKQPAMKRPEETRHA